METKTDRDLLLLVLTPLALNLYCLNKYFSFVYWINFRAYCDFQNIYFCLLREFIANVLWLCTSFPYIEIKSVLLVHYFKTSLIFSECFTSSSILWKVIAGPDDGLDYRQPHSMQSPESYTSKVIQKIIVLLENTYDFLCRGVPWWRLSMGIRRLGHSCSSLVSLSLHRIPQDEFTSKLYSLFSLPIQPSVSPDSSPTGMSSRRYQERRLYSQAAVCRTRKRCCGCVSVANSYKHYWYSLRSLKL